MRALACRVKVCLALAVLIAPVVADAETLSYRNLDFAYFVSADIDTNNGDVDGHGVQVRGMLPVYENFFALAEIQLNNYDFDIDTTRFVVGAGGHWPLASNVDIIGRLGIVHFAVDVGNFDDDDTGIFLGGRIRSMITPQFELEGGFDYFQVDTGGIDNETVLVAEARYHFNTQWSAGVLVNIGSDTNSIGVHGRLNF